MKFNLSKQFVFTVCYCCIYNAFQIKSSKNERLTGPAQEETLFIQAAKMPVKFSERF